MGNVAASTRGRLFALRYGHPRAFAALCAFAALLAARALVPDAALADGFRIPVLSDAFDLIDSIATLPGSLLASGFDYLTGVTVGDVSKPWGEFFGGYSGEGARVKNMATGVAKTFGYGCLGVIMMVKLVQISNRLDGNAAVPGLKEVVFTMVMFVVMKIVIDNSFLICQGIYELLDRLPNALEEAANVDSSKLNVFDGKTDKIQNIIDVISGRAWGEFLVYGLLFFVVGLILRTVAFVVALARFVQIYVMSIFAPVPLTFLFLDDTRSWGIGFLKNFAAVCLAGAIMVAVLMLLPLLMTYSIGFVPDHGSSVVTMVVPILAVAIVGIYGLIRSGAWARDIFGG